MSQDVGIKKLVGYVRVSSVAGRDQNQEAFQSPGVQREAMERWAAAKFGRNGYKWLKWFTDLDSSGSSIQRPLTEVAHARGSGTLSSTHRTTSVSTRWPLCRRGWQ